MNTYLFKDESHYKIGKSDNVFKRYNEILPHNPTVKIITSIPKNIETQLHRKYKKNRVHLEWFAFSDLEISKIIHNDFENPNYNEIPYLDYRITKGKYAGRKLISMFNYDEIKWLYIFDNPAFTWWTNNFTRYYFLKNTLINDDEITNKIEKNDNYSNVRELRKIINGIEILSIPDYAKKQNITYQGAKKRITAGAVDTVIISGITFIV